MMSRIQAEAVGWDQRACQAPARHISRSWWAGIVDPLHGCPGWSHPTQDRAMIIDGCKRMR